MAIKTFTPNLKRDPTLPTGLWDPLWNDPAVAARIAFEAYEQLRLERDFGTDELVAPAALPVLAPRGTEQRTFALGPSREVAGFGVRFRGGSYGEIFRRYTYGGTKPAVNFHAQGLAFGADSEGRFFMRAVVGRVDGGWGTRAEVCLRFVGASGELGGVAWKVELDPPKDVEMVVTGRSAALAADFDALREVRVGFFSHAG